MVEQSRLFKRLRELEVEEFGVENYPISSNIKTKLIPFCEDVLSRVPVYLPEFTLHDINHCYRILDNIESFLPEEIKLNIIEIQLLLHAIFLHDIGMSPSKEIFDKLENEVHENIKKDILKDGKLKSDLQSYIRKLHPKTSKDIIDSIYNYIEAGIDFTFKGIVLKDYIGNIIINHGIDAYKLLDDVLFPENEIIEKKFVDIRFLCVLLRLGDLLDIGLDRTPSYLSKYIKIDNEVSKIKWNKSQALRGKIIEPHRIMFNFYSTSSDLEREIKEYISYTENEIKECNKVLGNSIKQLKLSSNIKYKICTNNSYISTNSKVHLDFKNIINILKSTNLYADKAVFLRELFQNSYDAIDCKKEVNENLNGKIEINVDKNEFLFKDNGVGINDHIFKNYVIDIGKSYYNSDEFEDNFSSFKPIGKFGIGIISCFMVSDTIEIISIREDKYGIISTPIHYKIFVNEELVIAYPLNIKEFSNKYKGFNTIIKLKLRKDFISDFKVDRLAAYVDDIISYKKNDIGIVTNFENKLLNKNTFIENQKKFEKKFDHMNYQKIMLNNDNFEGSIYISFSAQTLPTIFSQSSINIGKLGNQLALKLRWINSLSTYIDLKNIQLDLKASRNEINYDEVFYNFRQQIIDEIITHIESNYSVFCNNADWHIDILQEKEFNFILNISAYVATQKNSIKKLITITLKNILMVKKTVWIHTLSFQNGVIDLADNPNILISNINGVNNIKPILYFLKLNNINYEINYIVEGKIMYLELEILEDVNENEIVFKDYDEELDRSIEYNYKIKDRDNRDILFIANDEFQSFLTIIINPNNKLGELLLQNLQLSAVRKLKKSLENMIENAVFNDTIIEKYESNSAYYMRVFDKQTSINTLIQGKFTNSFIEKLNIHLCTSIFNELNINEAEYNDYKITRNNFPLGYLKDE